MIIMQANGGTQSTRVVFNLKKVWMTFLLLAFFLFFFALAPTYVNATNINVKATASSSADVQVEMVNHTIQIEEGGLVIINDTLKLSPKPPETWVLLQNFSLGFPYEINGIEIIDILDYCFAYEASNPDERFEVELDVGLGRVGFYGVNVIFPQQGVNVTNGGYDLTVVFVFSNFISYIFTYVLDFPLYPSLTQNTSLCNVTVIMPPHSEIISSSLEEEGLDFNITTLDHSSILKHEKSPLNSFAYEPAWLTFDVEELVPGRPFPVISVHEIKREIKLDQWGGIHLSDSYYITNIGRRRTDVEISLPEDAYDVSARDEFGPIIASLSEGRWIITFRSYLEKDSSTKFIVTYSLPWKNYVGEYKWGDYSFAFTFLEQFEWTIRKLDVTVTLPEGAEFRSVVAPITVDVSQPANPYNIKKSVFQETITFTFSNVTPFHDVDFDLTYGYFVFWASFRPTLWMGVLAVIVCVVAILWRAPKPPPVPIVPVRPEDLRSFIDACERKAGILLELESMEEWLRKGRISRRRYKVRKKMLEGQLSTLSRDLTDLREKIRATGARYANTMRQIEVAETMLEGVETDIRRVEARYRRGEISKGAYQRLLGEYLRRRERAKTTIDGVLLRLREEIR